jgi:uncharacterized protein (TIGR00369 family)
VDEDVPAGFQLYTRPSPLIDPWRPLFMREDADRIVLGVRLREAHTNSRRTAHGGLIAALADQAMGMTCGLRLAHDGVVISNLWTTSLTIDYLSAAKISQWLAFETTFAHVGRTLCHAEVDVAADGLSIARGRGTFRVSLAKD